jgi:hypothetical protein
MKEFPQMRDDLAGEYEAATRRVERSPRMRKHKDILLSDRYADNAGYLRWLLLCNVGEIVEWAEQIRSNSDG